MTVFDATLGSPVRQAAISFSSVGAGDQIIVPGTTGFKVAVLQFFFVVSADVTLTYRSGTTDLTGAMPFLANGAQVQDFIQLPLTCADGDPFIINVDAAVILGGTIWYAKPPSVR